MVVAGTNALFAVGLPLTVRFAGFRAFNALRLNALDLHSRALMAQLHLPSAGLWKTWACELSVEPSVSPYLFAGPMQPICVAG